MISAAAFAVGCGGTESGCADGLTECGDTCVDTDVDGTNCGACGVTCDPGEICNGSGSCEVNCQAGMTNCSGTCVDTDNDEANCGDCGNACDPGELCDGAGACALNCGADLTECSGACVDTDVDGSHCGDCDTTCDPGEVCDGAGSCALTCQSGLLDCDGTCIDPATNPTYCGASGDCAAANAGETCADPANATGTCVDSGCSYVCDDGFADCNFDLDDGCETTCAGGVCDASTCAPAGLLVAIGTQVTTGDLYEVDPADATATSIGTIGRCITGMAFDVGGTLFATECNADPAKLLTIDTSTGAPNEIGDLVRGATNDNHISDIVFDGTTLYGYSETGGFDGVVVIDATSGAVTAEGTNNTSGSSTLTRDAAGTLYYTNHVELKTFVPGTGFTTVSSICERLRATAFHKGVMYGITGGSGGTASSGDLVIVNPADGTCTTVGALPAGADAIASPTP